MYTLILIFSIKSIYNHNIDSMIIPNLISDRECLRLGGIIKKDMTNLDSNINIVAYCEDNSLD